MSRLKPAARLMVAIILLASLSKPASAETRVIVAEGVDVAVGAEFPDDHVFDVPDNGKLIVLWLTYNASYWIGGPYKGMLEDYIARCVGKPVSITHCGEPAGR